MCSNGSWRRRQYVCKSGGALCGARPSFPDPKHWLTGEEQGLLAGRSGCSGRGGGGASPSCRRAQGSGLLQLARRAARRLSSPRVVLYPFLRFSSQTIKNNSDSDINFSAAASSPPPVYRRWRRQSAAFEVAPPPPGAPGASPLSIGELQRPYSSAGEGVNKAQWAVSSGAIPVLGFVVSQGAELLRRGVLSIDYPVDKLVVVQMGDNPAVSSVIAELLLLAEQDPSRHPHLATLRVAKLGNLGCAAGWNRIILEDLFAPYWLILNFDVAFPPGALRQVHANASEIFAAHERIGMIHLWYQWGGYKPEWSAFVLRRETCTISASSTRTTGPCGTRTSTTASG